MRMDANMRVELISDLVTPHVSSPTKTSDALAGVAAVVFFVALAPGPRLRAQHELTTWLQGHWVATTLEIKRIGSVRLFLNPTDRMMTPVLLHVRSWEPNETYWVMRSLRPGQTFVDIGANVGYYTVIASRLVGASGRVFAFEPDPVSFALLAYASAWLKVHRTAEFYVGLLNNQPMGFYTPDTLVR